jgi:hypothetical protein
MSTALVASLAALGCQASSEPPAAAPVAKIAQRVQSQYPLQGSEFSAQNIVPRDLAGTDPAIAFDGTNFFVTWQAEGYIVLAARINKAGQVLDTPPIAINRGLHLPVDRPAVAFDGTNYLVVWQQSAALIGLTEWGIHGTRVTPAGQVLDQPTPFIGPGPFYQMGLTLSRGTGHREWPAVVAHNGTFFVVWEDARDGTRDVYGTRVDGSGSVLDPNGILISGAAADQTRPALASDGQTIYVTWSDTRNQLGGPEVYAARIDKTLTTVLDPNGVAISSGPLDTLGEPQIAAFGGQALIAWDHGPDPYVARFDASGSVLDSGGKKLPFAASGPPAATHNGSNYFIAWGQYSGMQSVGGAPYIDLLGVHITPAGAVVEAAPIQITTSAEVPPPALAYDGQGSYFAAWLDWRQMDKDVNHVLTMLIYGGRITTAGAVLDGNGIAVARGLNEKVFPRLTRAAKHFFIAWTDGRELNGDAYGARIDLDQPPGQEVLDPLGIRLFDLPLGQELGDATSNGVQTLVVGRYLRYGLPTELVFNLSDSNGSLQSPAGAKIPGAVPAGPWHVRACAVGQDFFVAWPQHNGQDVDVHGARISAQGVVLDNPPLVVAGGSGDQTSPSVACNSKHNQILVVWEEPGAAGKDIAATRVSSTGAILDSAPLAISTAAGDQAEPRAAASDDGYLVLWTGSQTGKNLPYAGRIGIDGKLLDPQGLQLNSKGSSEGQAVAFFQTGYLALWVEGSANNRQIRTARVGLDGSVITSPSVSHTAIGWDPWPTVAPAGDGRFLIAYMGYDPDPALENFRLAFFPLTWKPLGGTCAADDECFSNACIDGVCCNGPCGGNGTPKCSVCSVALGASADGVCTVSALGQACRPKAGECDQAELCDGMALTCGADEAAPAGTPCSGGVCSGGSCIPASDLGDPLGDGPQLADAGVLADSGSNTEKKDAGGSTGDISVKAEARGCECQITGFHSLPTPTAVFLLAMAVAFTTARRRSSARGPATRRRRTRS